MGRLRSSFSSSLSVDWAGDPPWGGGCRLREAQPRSRRARTALEESQQSASRRHGRLPPQPTCTSQRSPRTPGTQDTAHSDLGSHSAAPCAFVASGAQNRKSNFTSTISHDYRTCVQPRSGNDALPPSSSSVSGSALVAQWLSCVCRSLGGDWSRRGGSGKSLAGGLFSLMPEMRTDVRTLGLCCLLSRTIIPEGLGLFSSEARLPFLALYPGSQPLAWPVSQLPATSTSVMPEGGKPSHRRRHLAKSPESLCPQGEWKWLCGGMSRPWIIYQPTGRRFWN